MPILKYFGLPFEKPIEPMLLIKDICFSLTICTTLNSPNLFIFYIVKKKIKKPTHVYKSVGCTVLMALFNTLSGFGICIYAHCTGVCVFQST